MSKHHNLRYCIWLVPLPYFRDLWSAVVESVELAVSLAVLVSIPMPCSFYTAFVVAVVQLVDVEFEA